VNPDHGDGVEVNETDWAKIEDSENEMCERPVPKIKGTRTLYVCGTDNDGYPTCQGDGSTCGLGGVCAELDPETPADAAGDVVPPPDGFLMGASDDEDDDDDEPPFVMAKYDGYCSACGDYHIAEGITMIRSDGNNGWEAEECAW
jgi:hypothetical protein